LLRILIQVRIIHTDASSCNDIRSRILAVSQEGFRLMQFDTFLLSTTVSMSEAEI